MTANASILFVDDEISVLNALKRAVRNMELDVHTAQSGEQGLAILAANPIDIVFSDKMMPQMSGNEFLNHVAEQQPETVRIMLTAHTELEDLIESVNNGHIWGYLQKPWDNSALRITIDQAIQTRDILAERSLLRHTLERYQGQRKRRFQQMIGDSMAMQFVYSAIEQSAPSRASVFITGQSGTGKELVAEAIHQLSTRKQQPLICLNCAAIPSELMESEIFGHVKGAFSGAVTNREGAASLADGGTLFLDELGEMDINLQAKILRFVQTGTFSKVGSSKTEKVDVRFISATNRDPHQAISQQRLREDLYYRLNVIAIDLPSLKERESDALQIAEYFLAQFSEQENKIFVGFASEAEQLILQYNWPGNIRQLQNVIHSAVVMSEGPLVTEAILARQLKLEPSQLTQLRQHVPVLSHHNGIAQPMEENTNTEITLAHIKPLCEVERAAIEQAIRLCGDNVVKAASKLEVSPSTLYRKIQQWENNVVEPSKQEG